VVQEVFVEFGREPPHLREPRAGDVRKIVVFVVVADVEGDAVQRAVIRIGVLSVAEGMVLGDVVTGDGMQAHAEQ